MRKDLVVIGRNPDCGCAQAAAWLYPERYQQIESVCDTLREFAYAGLELELCKIEEALKEVFYCPHGPSLPERLVMTDRRTPEDAILAKLTEIAAAIRALYTLAS